MLFGQRLQRARSLVELRGTFVSFVCYSANLFVLLFVPPRPSGLKFSLSDLKSDSRPERADFRPERAWGGMDGQTDGQRDGWTDRQTKAPMFYRTSSPLGPLPCFPSPQYTIMRSRATGIADHILPMGDLCIFVCRRMGFGVWIGVGCFCLPVCNDIVTPRHLLKCNSQSIHCSRFDTLHENL